MEKKNVSTYQWMVMLFGTWLTTLIRTLSPSLATMRGPGNWPFTVTMLLLWHNRVTFFNVICPHIYTQTLYHKHENFMDVCI